MTDTTASKRLNLAVTYFRMPDHDAHIQDIIQNLNRALEIDPNFYRATLALGIVYDMLGDKDKAKYYHDCADAILNQSQ